MTDQPLIALIDMDGTVADYEGQLLADLEHIRGPEEPVITNIWEHHGPHVTRRMSLIKNMPSWWKKLPVIEDFSGCGLYLYCFDHR